MGAVMSKPKGGSRLETGISNGQRSRSRRFPAGFTPLEIRVSNRGFRVNRRFLTGFTLIELLVVIAIIALLMSILVPSLAKARKQAKNAICLSNLKQWGSAFGMYTSEWNGSFHMGWPSDAGLPEPKHRWYLALRPYYSNQKELLKCPMAAKELTDYGNDPSGGTFNTWDGGTHDGQHYYGSYGICTCLANVRDPEPGNWRRDDIKQAGLVPLLLDAQFYTAWPWWTEEPPDYPGARWRSGGANGNTGLFCIPRHGETINGIFVDYSARKIGLKELWLLHFCPAHRWTAARAKASEPLWPEWMERFRDYDFIRAQP